MTALTWDKPSNPRFEAGVDRGVVYPNSGGGFVWNGLTAVNEEFEGGEVEAIRFDGVLRNNLINNRSWMATVNAFAIPRALEQCVGMVELAPGFILTRQPPRPFGFSYRVMTSENSYVTHLVYNATAIPRSRMYASRSDKPEPTNLVYQINATPPQALPATYSTAHFTLDPAIIPAEAYAVISQYLYGTARNEPRLPSIQEILDIIFVGDFRSIFPNSVTGKAVLADNQTTNLDLSASSRPGLYTRMPDTRLYQDINDLVGLFRLEQ